MATKRKKAQAAFEYLITYGWAILAALVAIGALAYFGFLNPTNLLPANCDFGNQLDCVEYRVYDNASIDIKFRNNFGKDINITFVSGDVIASNTPLIVNAGTIGELKMILNNVPTRGEKTDFKIVVMFSRAGAGNPVHNISGKVFDQVQKGN